MRSAISEVTIPTTGVQALLVISCGVALAYLLLRLSAPLVAAGVLAIIFCVTFLQRPDLGLLFVLLVRSFTDMVLVADSGYEA